MNVYTLDEIKRVADPVAVIDAIAAGFVAYSRGEVTVPPVGHLSFKTPPGDVHIKYGHRREDPSFVVKIASGFYDNPKRGLSSSSGLMLVFSADTGFLESILLDEGYLTDLRTAAAGAVAARCLAPKQISGIGIVGAGIQARMQLDLLRHVTPCREAWVWARDPRKAAAFTVDGFTVQTVANPDQLFERCQLIVTTTPSDKPLLSRSSVRNGVHITAVGADGPGKQELDPELFRRAHVRAVDARSQALRYGDSSHALAAGLVAETQFVELGEILADPSKGRTADHQLTIADLTGVAVQDIQIAQLVSAALRGTTSPRP